MSEKYLLAKVKSRCFILFQRSPRFIKHYLSKIIYKPKLGKNVWIIGYAVFGPEVEVGDYTYFNDNARIHNMKIGRYTRIAKNFQYISTCAEYLHFSNYKFWGSANSPLIASKSIATKPLENLNCNWSHCHIGNDVWIGENVTIVGEVNIGDGAVIGANSVVTKDVEPFAIVAGNPAHFIKYRLDSSAINKLMQIKWWEWDIEEIYEKYDMLLQLGAQDFK